MGQRARGSDSLGLQFTMEASEAGTSRAMQRRKRLGLTWTVEKKQGTSGQGKACAYVSWRVFKEYRISDYGVQDSCRRQL